jgi:hypothetical protein
MVTVSAIAGTATASTVAQAKTVAVVRKKVVIGAPPEMGCQTALWRKHRIGAAIPQQTD